MNSFNKFEKYCTGCGLCNFEMGTDLKKNAEGFFVCNGIAMKDYEFFKNVCPAGGVQCESFDTTSIWGKNKEVCIAYSSDEAVRYSASSGGTLSALGLYLIESGKVDGIIQTRMDPDDPISAQISCSVSREDVLRCVGSRYADSVPLKEIGKYLNSGKKFAYIGKPCDVTVLRNYAKINKDVNTSIPYMLSFFCAGEPSENANLELLDKLGVKRGNCVQLKYRGEGWPGSTVATDAEGRDYKLAYKDTWGGILGRHIRPICRFCLDGIGEMADISCGDAWHLTEENKPSFEESPGRNVVFVRTNTGKNIFMDAVKEGYLIKENYLNWERELDCCQPYQKNRRASMEAMFSALKLIGKEVPNYDRGVLKAYASTLNCKEKLKRFIGTLKRSILGRIK